MGIGEKSIIENNIGRIITLEIKVGTKFFAKKCDFMHQTKSLSANEQINCDIKPGKVGAFD